jgi:hypothetical protein
MNTDTASTHARLWKIAMALAIVGGLASGPMALEAGMASVPPIEWSILPTMFFASAIALYLVFAFQVALKNRKAVQLGWKFFAIAAAYMTISGLSSIGTAWMRPNIEPGALTILVFGCGTMCGLLAVKATFGKWLRSEA